jgi:bacillolysin
MPKLSFDILSKLLTTIPLLLVVAPVAHAADPLTSMKNQGAAIDRDEQSGYVVHIGKGIDQPMNAFNSSINKVSGLTAIKNDTKDASTILQTFGPSFGLSNPTAQMQVIKKTNTISHYQQIHQGIPVIGGEMVISMAKNQFNSMNGGVSQDLPQETTPKISSNEAIASAKLLVQKKYGLYDVQNTLEATKPELKIYDPKLLDTGDKNGPARLVWKMIISPANGPSDVHEQVLIDAQTGSVALNFNKTQEARERRTYDAAGATAGFPSLVCNEGGCAGGASTDAVLAHQYAGDTYNFYNANIFGLDSFDNKGLPLSSVVRFGVGYKNAVWDGTKMIYGDGYASADDVVAHELTHGLTQYNAPLFNDMPIGQAGAINESYSDIFGELVDLSNGAGSDGPQLNWLLGEDLPNGFLRNMANPLQTPGSPQPDRMTSPYYNFVNGRYITGEPLTSDDAAQNDRGAVHQNNGVGNKAAAFITSRIGIQKAARLYFVSYRYLKAGTTYADLFNHLNDSCNFLMAYSLVTPEDCNVVSQGLKVAEMNVLPVH